jgi:hypothetical protein
VVWEGPADIIGNDSIDLRVGRGSLMTRDVVIGTISGYDWQTVQYWANSLDACGFAGRKVVLACNAARNILDALAARGYEVVTYATNPDSGDAYYPADGFANEDASAERFYLMWAYLAATAASFRYVISADVKDLVFQTNPSEWLESTLGDSELNVSSERLRYEDEEWNSASLLENFGAAIHEHMRRQVIWNAGAIAGTASCMRDLCLGVHLLCRASKAAYSDQAALNILLSLEPFRRITRFNDTEAAWACHAGTFAPPWIAEKYGPKLLETGSIFDGDSVYASSGTKYCIVHQYDRVPDWRDALRTKYQNATAGTGG